MKLATMAQVREATRALYRTRSVKRRQQLEAAIADALARATCKCPGEAHSNAHVDHCGVCSPFWGVVLPQPAARWFVANDDDTFTCEHCVPDGTDIGSTGIEVWAADSTGWTADVHCHRCKAMVAKKDEPSDDDDDLSHYAPEHLIESVRAGGISRWSFNDAMTSRGLATEARAVLDALESAQ